MLTEQDIDYFRQRLVDKKLELLAKIEQYTIPPTSSDGLSDDVDLANTLAQQTFLEKMLLRDKGFLKEVEDALLRIKTGEFGYCEGTGEEINRKRLELQPWCRYTVSHQEKLERMGKKGGRGFSEES